jgi:hypothetical protein
VISISKLLYETDNYGDSLRYSQAARGQEHGTVAGRGPVVVWNCTRACNLRCVHCYASASQGRHARELDTGEGKTLLDDLAAFKVPVILFSGGEPLLRPDFFELAGYAADLGLRSTISTNGTLITPEVRRYLDRPRPAGVSRAQEPAVLAEGALCPLPLAGDLQRQFPQPGRGGLPGFLGRGPGLLPDGRGDQVTW